MDVRKTFPGTVIVMLMFGLIWTLSASGPATKKQEIVKTFEAKDLLVVKTTSGNCEVKAGKSGEITVSVFHTYPEGSYEPIFEESSDRLRIEEDFYHSGNHSGRSRITVTVPPGTEIEFSSASGDFSSSNVIGKIEAETASGDLKVVGAGKDVELSAASGDISVEDTEGGRIDCEAASGDIKMENVSGDLTLDAASGRIRVDGMKSGEADVSAASGSIEIFNSKAVFEVNAASGNIEVRDVVITGKSSFSAASGDVEVKLGAELEYDVALTAASGDVELDFEGNPVQGFFELTVKKNYGEIDSPFEYDKVESFYQNNREFVRMTATIGSSKPRIRMSSSSGSVTVLE